MSPECRVWKFTLGVVLAGCVSVFDISFVGGVRFTSFPELHGMLDFAKSIQ